MNEKDARIRQHPILKFDRGKKIRFFFKGKPVEGYENETIAMALYANGIRTFSHSFKFHRPRGMFCAIGKCASCLMEVDGIPNVRTCITPIHEGADVRPQGKTSLIAKIGYFLMNHIHMGPGFYYRHFIHPGFMYQTYISILEKFIGPGKYPTKVKNPPKTVKKEVETMEAEIVVIGAGPAGASAAIYAANLGAKVILIDENKYIGGQLIKQTHKFFGSARHYAGIRGITIAKQFEKEVKENKNIILMLDSKVVGIYDGNIVGVLQKNRFLRIKPKKLIVTTGAYEKTLVFENNDLPGIMGAGGIQTVMNVFGIKPGNEALIVGAGNVGLILAYQLLQAGVTVKGIVEAMPTVGGYFVHAAKVRRYGIPIYTRHTIVKALGKKHVTGAVIAQLDDKWQPIPGTEKKIKCDLIGISVGLRPANELLLQAGCEMKFVSALGGFIPLRTENNETTVKGVYVAGDLGGVEEASTAIMEGRIAGISAAMSLGYKAPDTEEVLEKIRKDLADLRAGPVGERIRAGIKQVLIEG
ncbi:MAG: FAD-dependent oxidoreductase [Candidatus Odinarchaeota archaeon]|nr:FAD-dependent oxidoreductase [Candidatus Odinarchaeota archaeon]